MTINIDAALADSLMAQAVAKKGEDHVVTDCIYINSETYEAECIVGTALSLIVPQQKMKDVFIEVGGLNTTIITSPDVQAALAVQGVNITPEATRLFRAAQRSQDMNEPWGKALVYARNYK